MKTKKINIPIVSLLAVLLMLFAGSCKEEVYDFLKPSPECGIVELVINYQLTNPLIITPTYYEQESKESQVKIGVNKLIDYSNIRFKKLTLSKGAKAYYNNEEIDLNTLEQKSFISEYLETDETGTDVYAFQMKIVAENGNERIWHFYLKPNPPINLDFVNGAGTLYSYFGQNTPLGRILVGGLDNDGTGMWRMDNYEVKNKRYSLVRKLNPTIDILLTNGTDNEPTFSMRDDYIKFNPNGTYEYSYGPDGLSKRQDDTDSYQGYFIEKGFGEWSITGSTVNPPNYLITLSNYETGGSSVLDKCNYNVDVLTLRVLAGTTDKLQFSFFNVR